MAKFLALAYQYRAGEDLPGHRDYFVDDDGHVQELSINKVASVGLAVGLGSGYAPGGEVRRDQMATFLVRWLDLAVERVEARRPQQP
jgi:hypothetical protein